MTTIDRHTLDQLTQLSRIECTGAEADALLEDLKNILGYVETLQALDTEGVEVCSYVLPDQVNVMREDHVGQTMDRDEFIANAPSHVGGMVRVPTILKKQIP